jgi:pimeloyl-ACP methyl ester carboxylesterase
MDDTLRTAAPPLRHGRAFANDILQHYVTAGPAGEGETVTPVALLLHGWLGTWYSWRKVIPLLAAEGFTVVAPDLRGLGDTDKPESGYDAENMARDVRGLLEQVGLAGRPTVVAGHDMGAPVALVYAYDYAEDVRGLAYIDEPLPGFNLERFTRFAPDNPLPYWWFGFHSQHNLAEALVAGREREYLEHFLRIMVQDQTAITGEDREEYLRTFASAGGVRGSFGWYRAIHETSAQIRERAEARGKLAVPVVGVNGAWGHPETGEQIKAVAENVFGAVLSDCGHLVPEEKPRELVAAILPLLKGVAR